MRITCMCMLMFFQRMNQKPLSRAYHKHSTSELETHRVRPMQLLGIFTTVLHHGSHLATAKISTGYIYWVIISVISVIAFAELFYMLAAVWETQLYSDNYALVQLSVR